ncbi:MAG: sigma-54 dependent transcriptional regulator [Firmicutes bacterium]|nr:sigma-54 dependent transcriptional regulator [Bacillota bacterium]
MSAKEAAGATILIVDDSAFTLEVLQRNLVSEGYRVFSAIGAAQAFELLEKEDVDLVITDLKMPDVDGMTVVRHVRENYRDMEVIMMTGYATVESAVNAVKAGAQEYLPKPFTDEELFGAVRRALEKLKLRRLSEEDFPQGENWGIIGKSNGIRQIFRIIRKASSTYANTLISGESGTGKELVARAIHYGSTRASSPFVPVNCGAIPDSLLESELFGHIKGAFTGAYETRAGFFQTADGGTIFLDEIADMGLSMQTKLLRVLQDREITMVGSRKSQKVDVRIIAATNKDLYEMVRRNQFREDLYYRLNVIVINVIPLRERDEDIILLCRWFINRFSAEAGRKTPDFSAAVIEDLKGYYWPGNVRELENLMQRLAVMVDSDIIEPSDLPPYMRFSAPRPMRLDRTLAEVEGEYIKNVLDSVSGNKTKAAEILAIDRKTLREKLKKIGME